MMLVGRDELLSRTIYPMINKKSPFLLVGRRGIGKTAILDWSYENCSSDDKVFIACSETYGDIVKKIALKLGIEIKKLKVAEIEKEILKQKVTKNFILFIDNINYMTPKQAIFFTSLNESWTLFLAGREPFKEEVKRLVWGKKIIKVEPLDQRHRQVLAKHIVTETGCLMSIGQIVSECKGVPGRAWALANGKSFDFEHVEGEEINIASMLFLFVVGIVIMKYMALGMGEKDLYIMAGIGVGLTYFLRILIREMM